MNDDQARVLLILKIRSVVDRIIIVSAMINTFIIFIMLVHCFLNAQSIITHEKVLILIVSICLLQGILAFADFNLYRKQKFHINRLQEAE